jgi:hypothetical protein
LSNSVAVAVAAAPVEQVNIPFKPSKGALRQEIAARLAQANGAMVTSANNSSLDNFGTVNNYGIVTIWDGTVVNCGAYASYIATTNVILGGCFWNDGAGLWHFN